MERTALQCVDHTQNYLMYHSLELPGEFLSLLAGALFGVSGGLALVVCSATAGASSWYLLLKMVGRPIAYRLWPDKLHYFIAEIARRKKKLLKYMLFLRVIPALLNVYINAASPIVDGPYQTFLLATFFGCISAALSHLGWTRSSHPEVIEGFVRREDHYRSLLIGLVSIVPTWVDKIKTREIRRRGSNLHSS